MEDSCGNPVTMENSRYNTVSPLDFMGYGETEIVGNDLRGMNSPLQNFVQSRIENAERGERDGTDGRNHEETHESGGTSNPREGEGSMRVEPYGVGWRVIPNFFNRLRSVLG